MKPAKAARPPAPPSGNTRAPWNKVEFAALDFEATGLDFRRDTVISFGVVPIRNGRIEVGEAVYELVDPGEVPHSHEAITIHGLRPADLRGMPSLVDARERLAAALTRRFLVTWFAGVEAAFLDKVFGGGARSWLRRAVDVRKLVVVLDRREGRPGQPGALSLAGAARRYGVPVASPHNALDDALVTAQLFLVVATALGRHGYRTVRHLLSETTGGAPLLHRPRAPNA